MRGAITPFPQYAFLAWCSVKNGARNVVYGLVYMYWYSREGNRKEVRGWFEGSAWGSAMSLQHQVLHCPLF